VDKIRLTGGEPLIRPDVVDIVGELVTCHFLFLSPVSSSRTPPLTPAYLTAATPLMQTLSPGTPSKRATTHSLFW
jgi:hypothetical protein